MTLGGVNGSGPVTPQQGVGAESVNVPGQVRGRSASLSDGSPKVKSIAEEGLKGQGTNSTNKQLLPGRARPAGGIISKSDAAQVEGNIKRFEKAKQTAENHRCFNRYPDKSSAEHGLTYHAEIIQGEQLNLKSGFEVEKLRRKRYNLEQNRDLHWKREDVVADFNKDIKEVEKELNVWKKSTPVVLTYALRQRSDPPNDGNVHYSFSVCTRNQKGEDRVNHFHVDYDVEKNQWKMLSPSHDKTLFNKDLDSLIKHFLSEIPYGEKFPIKSQK